MPKGTQLSANGGELTEFMDPRVDFAKYSKGCKKLENMHPLPHGSALARPGTVHGGEAKYSARKAILIPFVFSTTTTMELEFGHEYMRVWLDQSPVMDGDDPFEIVTPYQEAELPELQYEQINDVVYIVHPNHEPRRLSRFANDNWTIETIDFLGSEDYPPLEDTNIDEDHVLSITGDDFDQFGGIITLTSTHDMFESDCVGEFMMVGHRRTQTELAYNVEELNNGTSEIMYVLGDWAFQTAGVNKFTIDYQESKDKVNWKTKRNYDITKAKNIQTSGTEVKPTYMRMVISDYSDPEGDPSRAYIECAEPLMTGLVKITGYTDAKNVTAEVIEPIQMGDDTYQWARQYFRSGTSWPRAICIHKDRLCLASNDVWMSQPDNYENFRKRNDADAAFMVPIRRSGSPKVNWMHSLRDLRVGTNQAEAVIVAENSTEVFAYDNFAVRWDSNYGSKAIRAEAVSGTVFFLQPSGRTLRYQQITGIEEYYDANTLTTLADHILGEGVRQTAYQRQRYPTYHAVREDGQMASLVYEQSHNIMAWYRTVTDGSIESVSITPMPDEEDRVAMIVKRMVGGVEKRHVEFVAYNQYRTIQNGDIENMWFVDDGIKVTGEQMTSVSGLEHLEGVTVAILADGALMEEREVTNGSIDLDHASNTVIVGRPYDMTLIPMNLEAQGTMGRSKNIASATLKLWRSGRAYVRVNEGEYSLIDNSPQYFSEAPELFSGDSERVALSGDWYNSTTIEIKGRSPVPINVQAITLEYEMGRG